MRTIELEQTFEAFPEQYWAKTGAKTIGYIRLRFGRLTCDYLPYGEANWDDKIRLLEYIWKGDEYKGSFDSEEERKLWLSKCKDALMDEYKKRRSNKRNK